MRKIYALCVIMLAFGSLFAQNLASTTPENKNAVIEEFTGVSCPNCPPGHAIVKDLKTQYPMDAWVVAYHPTNSSFTTPRGGVDMRRAYLDNFYQSSFVGSRFMPSAMINRRQWGTPAERNTSRGTWVGYANTMMAEASPVNMGIEAVYDTMFNEVQVTVELYYTADAAEQTLYVMLMEDNLVANQSGSGGSANYVHSHIFREVLTDGQWGEAITTAPVMGNTYSKSFVFDNSTGDYKWEDLTLIAFVRDVATEEVITGTGLDDIPLPTINTGIDFQDISNDVAIYPNPSEGLTTAKLTLTEATPVVISLFNTMGQKVAERDFGVRSAGTQRLTFDSSELSAGVYLMHVEAGSAVANKRLVKQ